MKRATSGVLSERERSFPWIPEDLKKPIVKLKAGKALAKAVTLEEIKKNKLFQDSPLVKIGRLSVVPLTEAQYAALIKG